MSADEPTKTVSVLATFVNITDHDAKMIGEAARAAIERLAKPKIAVITWSDGEAAPFKVVK